MGVVEAKREVSRADIAEPKMFTPAKLPPIAIEGTAKVGRKSFRQEQLAFAEGTEGNGAGWVGTFMKHRLVPFFSSVELAREISGAVHAKGRSVRGHVRSN